MFVFVEDLAYLLTGGYFSLILVLLASRPGALGVWTLERVVVAYQHRQEHSTTVTELLTQAC